MWKPNGLGIAYLVPETPALVSQRLYSLFYYLNSVRLDDLARVQDRFESAFNVRGAPEYMLLVQASHPEPGYCYLIWISDKKDSLALYLGLRSVGREGVPKEAVMLAGYAKTFEQFFTYAIAPGAGA